MSKKVRCKECSNAIMWALPVSVTNRNYEYAKQCLLAAKRSIVCGITSKVKRVNNEQHCKKFCGKSNDDIIADTLFKEEISNLEQLIHDYESNKTT